MNQAMKIFLIIVSANCHVCASRAQEPARPDPSSANREDAATAVVGRAEQFASARLFAKVHNSGVVFRWIGNTDRFWYRKYLDQSHSAYFVVDAASGRQTPLFDAAAISASLARAGASGVTDGAIRSLAVLSDGRSMIMGLSQPGATCRWPQSTGCDMPTVRYQCALPNGDCRRFDLPEVGYLLSPDRRKAAFVRRFNIWEKDVETGAERQLTHDGVENYAYGAPHLQGNTALVKRRRAGLPDPLNGVLWSPDGRLLIALRHDLRAVPERLASVEYVPPEGGMPIVHTARQAIPLDTTYPPATLDVIDTNTGAVHRSDIDPQAFVGNAINYFNAGQTWWSNGNDRLWLIAIARGDLEERLVSVDLADGHARDAIVERSDKPLINNPNSGENAPNVAVLGSGGEALWFSQRDGWGHLYLYDTGSGRLKRQVTQGDWLVADLLRVDEQTRTVFFTAVGREKGRNPYYRHLYSVGLDGGTPRLLTPEDADHDFENKAPGPVPGGSISPSGRYFLDSYSTITQPDRAVVRNIDGQGCKHVLDADASELQADGWHPPERFVAKAADGITDLYGVLIKPRDFDPSKRYPIIEITYPGPQSKFNPTMFREDFGGSSPLIASTTLNAYALAETGAIIVALDGRGTGYRSAAFHDAFFNNAEDPRGVIDHVAAIKAVAASRPYMDLGRVGITGHSYGGYGSLRSILLYPGFFKVAVSGEGPGDFLEISGDTISEAQFGIPDDPATLARYRRVSNESLASRLTGKLLMIFGGVDENVHLQNAFQLFAAFQKADKSYDTLIIPDAPHFGGREAYGVRQTIRYFATNLGGPG